MGLEVGHVRMSRDTCVSYYTTGTATVARPFPQWANGLPVVPYIQYREGLKRHQCALTGEFLPYPFDSRGAECPVIFDKEEGT